MAARRAELGPRARAGLLLTLSITTVLLAVAPEPVGSPIRRLANYDADSRDPIYNVPLDGEALRRAGAVIPDFRDETYYIQTRQEAQLGHDLIGASLLFFLPARPVPDPRRARWILSYQAPEPLPPGVEPLGRVRLGPAIELVRVRPA